MRAAWLIVSGFLRPVRGVCGAVSHSPNNFFFSRKRSLVFLESCFPPEASKTKLKPRERPPFLHGFHNFANDTHDHIVLALPIPQQCFVRNISKYEGESTNISGEHLPEKHNIPSCVLRSSFGNQTDVDIFFFCKTCGSYPRRDFDERKFK